MGWFDIVVPQFHSTGQDEEKSLWVRPPSLHASVLTFHITVLLNCIACTLIRLRFVVQDQAPYLQQFAIFQMTPSASGKMPFPRGSTV
jgi:hypothetical protein